VLDTDVDPEAIRANWFALCDKYGLDPDTGLDPGATTGPALPERRDVPDEDVAWFDGDPAEAVDVAAFVRELVHGRRPAWHAHAACNGHGTATWFPEQGESLDPARTICASCPVAIECASAGIDEPFGVWAGTSAKQRTTARRAAGRRPAGERRSPARRALPCIACELCGAEFQPPTPTSRYCSRKCTRNASYRRRRSAAA
jgi:hypothetical protein